MGSNLFFVLCRSLIFHDFVAKCLTKEPRLRPTAFEMLKVWKKGLLLLLLLLGYKLVPFSLFMELLKC